MFEPIDPARVPPRWLAWLAVLIAVLLAVAYGVWRSQISSSPTDAELSSKATKPVATTSIASIAPSAAPADTAESVVLTAISDVWLRVYDQNGERLLEKQMTKGESYTVPANAHNPMLTTGQPEALAVTVKGKPVPPLGPPEKTLTDFPISAAALLARPATPATPAPAQAARPTNHPRPATPTPTEPATTLQLSLPSPEPTASEASPPAP